MMVAVVAMLAFSMPAYASKMDSQIESSAKQSYIFKTYLQADDIKIQSENGVVSLTGTVSEESHKSLAQDTVANLPNVKSVDNMLEIKSTPPPEKSDAWVMMKVKTTLWFHRSVNGFKTEVNDVKDGIVTLTGEATSQAQKDLTTEYAKDVQGVKDVKNKMTIAGAKTSRTVGQNIDDASITAQVKMMLLYHRSTSALNTSVTTKKGVVTLVGKASNAAELNMATKLANDVNGVKDVKNQMTIE
jgi:osmotically-inducible protein OsmY